MDKDEIDYQCLSYFLFDFGSDWSYVVTFVHQSWNVVTSELRSGKSFI